MMKYLRRSSMLPPYMAYPRFLLTMNLSETAKLVYVLLLDRARLSMASWEQCQKISGVRTAKENSYCEFGMASS